MASGTNNLSRRRGLSLPDTVRVSAPVFLLYAALFYNAFLAFVNAHGVNIGNGLVLAVEAAILGVGCIYLFNRRRYVKERLALVLASVFVYAFLFVWISTTNGTLFVKSLGDFIIIFVFFLLGTQCTSKQLITAFRIATLAVVAGMLIEGLFVNLYASVFEPAAYYASTRGIGALSVDSSGLFRNALGFEGRFSYGLFGMRRLSSLFLEQVSLANFSMVLAIFTMTFWRVLKRWDRALLITSVVFMILSTSSRTGTAMCLLMFAGYFVFPYLPRVSFRFIMPVILLGSFLLFYNPNAGSELSSDDAKGRIGHTVTMLATVEWKDFLTGNVSKTDETDDSGYTYLVYSQTIFGLVYFWWFLAKILPMRTDDEKRFAQGTTLYIAFNLLIGAAIFSIKVSAPLWLIAGCLASQFRRDKVPQVAHG